MVGAPTGSTVQFKVLATGATGSVFVRAQPSGGGAAVDSGAVALQANGVSVLSLGGLLADTAYNYELRWTPPSGTEQAAVLGRFQTARPPGREFVFTVQADSHLDENSSLPVYQRTLQNVLADRPDFHVDLGDTFMTEKHSDPLSELVQMAPDAATVNRRYVYERGNFAAISHAVPLFLANGNHEGEAGWLNNGSGSNLAVWATQARQQYFANPAPGIFYRGDTLPDPFVGARAAWYSWTWGDAQFIVLDPYWNTAAPASKDGWNLTLGERQYRWLADTLATSTARMKFVFVHNLVGGLDGQMRGGVEGAPYFEWGGLNADGSAGFAARRPGWGLPIHELLKQHKVNAVFKGHDHLHARQELDGILYLTVAQPSAVNTTSAANLARDYHYAQGTILPSAGHLRVTVKATGYAVEYVRSWQPTQETATRKNGQVDDRVERSVP
ncbi:metallophosphoesterase [Inhella crocodyli]|uniref:Metallophosphoesterase n=1 Tax=Inhella crocodyli TaxID=2499851 RepID=A0A437LI36_9BURK|nr:metallophosphoesterase [Inhella crocodyli]